MSVYIFRKASSSKVDLEAGGSNEINLYKEILRKLIGLKWLTTRGLVDGLTLAFLEL